MKRQQSVDAFFHPIANVNTVQIDHSLGMPSSSTIKRPKEVEEQDLEPESGYAVRYDIANYLKTEHLNLSDEEKTKIIKNRIPLNDFKYPGKEYTDKKKKSGVRIRHCQGEWLVKFSTMAYSVEVDGIYCLCCILFPVQPKHGKRAGILIFKPLRNWKDALCDLNSHCTLDYHRDSEERMNYFLQTSADPTRRIDCRIIDVGNTRIKTNQNILMSVIKCVEICGRMTWALRGHQDDGLLTTCDDFTQGNFKTLIKFRIDAGDTVLKEHFENRPKNAQYCSKTIQKEIIDCIGTFMQGYIVDEIKQQAIGPKFGLSCDEVTDTSNTKQMGVVLRYTRDGQAIERLVEYVDCESITGIALAGKLKKTLNNLGLCPVDCRAQTYDGGSNMSGVINGCAALFMKVAPKAPYYHCVNHDLNLALSKASGISEVVCMLSTVREVGLFFKSSPKRQSYLNKLVQEYNANAVHHITKDKLKLLCETRWVERHTSIFDFGMLLKPLMACLTNIVNKVDVLTTEGELTRPWDAKTVADANGLICRITTPSFIVAFQSASLLFGYTSTLAINLQGQTQDILTAYDSLQEILTIFQEMKDNAPETFDKLYRSRISDMAKILEIDINIPRRSKSQTMRNNVPGDDPVTYWRRSVFIPYLDTMINELKSRFSHFQKDTILALNLIPVNISLLTSEQITTIQNKFNDDVPSPGSLAQELELWKLRWRGVNEPPTSISDTLSKNIGGRFPNIFYILNILLLIPVSSATVERAHSALKLVKTRLRSTIQQDRLNGLVLLAIHKDIPLDYHKIVTLFGRQHPHRMLLSNPLSDE